MRTRARARIALSVVLFAANEHAPSIDIPEDPELVAARDVVRLAEKALANDELLHGEGRRAYRSIERQWRYWDAMSWNAARQSARARV